MLFIVDGGGGGGGGGNSVVNRFVVACVEQSTPMK
jgi:hypothetical protein